MSKELKISFVKTPHYQLVPVTGAWGGPNVSGEIIIDFYLDRTTVPEEVVMLVDEGGTVAEKSRSPQQTIRELQVGMVMRPDIALVIGNFLIEKANAVLNKGKISVS